MLKRKHGFSDLYLTTIGLGTWAIGGGNWEWGWGPQDDKESIETIQRAIDLGINWIDTAAAYGLGHSEELIAKALAGRRDQVVIATKCGLVWEDDGSGEVNGRLKADSVRKETENSLRRLKTDVIDLFQIHWPNPDEDIEEGWNTVADLIREGKVRYGGVSNFDVSQMQRIQQIHPIASLQPEYSMFQREPENGLLEYCISNEIGVIAYSPLRSGILTENFTIQRLDSLAPNDWRRRDDDFLEPRVSINLKCVEKLNTLAREWGLSLAQLSTAWVIAQPGVTAAIVGARRVDQIEASAPAADLELNGGQMAQIEALLQEREALLSGL
jgi:aryl-alcohol dehydrogenase-like predicted oxidoreductase